MLNVTINFSVNSGIGLTILISTILVDDAVSDVIFPPSAQMTNISYVKQQTTSFAHAIIFAVIALLLFVIALLRCFSQQSINSMRILDERFSTGELGEE